MKFNKIAPLLAFLLCWLVPNPSSADTQPTTLETSVNQALKYSPQLRALTYNYEATEHDLTQSRARYRPSIDLQVGYGLEQHSDDITRQTGANPTNSDWDPRTDISLNLVQKVYDGGETRQQVSIQKSLLESVHFHLREATQAITLKAISAHLDVYRQRELISLAEKNLEVHRDIYQLLAEREQAGAGNIADVTQSQARMARAQSNLFIKKADFSRAIANYLRVVGAKPENLAYAQVPDKKTPVSLEEALRWTEQKNPELLAFKTDLVEAGARVTLARSAYKPKINIELSSRYNDQLEGDLSWQNTNDAMVTMRWNLYKGGQDKAGEKAALSRKQQSLSNLNDKLFELREATSSAWAIYKSLQSQKMAYQDAVTYSKKTFEAYLKQFSVSRRELLDVLSAANDYFQSASQLVTVNADETIAAYHLLKLGGELQNPYIWSAQVTEEVQ